MKIRETTRHIIALAEAGAISWKDIAESALWWMADTDVAKMAKANKLIPEDKKEN